MDFLHSLAKATLSSLLFTFAFSGANASMRLATDLDFPSLTDASLVATQGSTDVTIATFNVKWYGLGGSMTGSSDKEKRDPTLKKFIQQEVMPADLIVFEEVVDVPRLKKLLPAKWSCQSYQNPVANHQHVVTCVSEKYKFQLVDYDDNNTIETVAINGDRSRPAVRLNVTNLQNKVLFTLVGVHLKAYPNESETRAFQAGEIAKDLAHLSTSAPVLVTGDFNTYKADQSGESEDDTDLILQKLNQMGASFTHVQTKENYTFRSGSLKGQFDHFYLAGKIKAKGAPDVFDVCNSTSAGQEFMNISYYNKNVSDHCPVKLTVTIPGSGAAKF